MSAIQNKFFYASTFFSRSAAKLQKDYSTVTAEIKLISDEINKISKNFSPMSLWNDSRLTMQELSNQKLSLENQRSELEKKISSQGRTLLKQVTVGGGLGFCALIAAALAWRYGLIPPLFEQEQVPPDRQREQLIERLKEQRQKITTGIEQIAEEHQKSAEELQKFTERHQELTEKHQELTEKHQRFTETHQKHIEGLQKTAEEQQKIAEEQQRIKEMLQEITERAYQNQ